MVVKLYQPAATCSPSVKADSYIYSIVPTSSNGLAAITSADELVLLDRATLQKVSAFNGVPTGVTCLQQGDKGGHILLCSGRDGSVASFDVRSKAMVSQFKLDRAVTALVCNDSEIGVGTELAHQQAIVSVRDRRQNASRWQNSENNDDITDLHFHPSRHNHLLSGGIDGLVSIFDTNVQDEEDSLLQVINHGPIHKAGFFSDEAVYALSHDEQLSIHAITSSDQADSECTNDKPPVEFGDLRPILNCEYAIDVSDRFVAVGMHCNEPRVDLVPLQGLENCQLVQDEIVRLMGAHGEEVVRAIYVDPSGTIFTAGEDGHVNAFVAQEAAQGPTTESSKHKRKDSKHTTTSNRYRPY